jgi:hypothetical protein
MGLFFERHFFQLKRRVEFVPPGLPGNHMPKVSAYQSTTLSLFRIIVD